MDDKAIYAVVGAGPVGTLVAAALAENRLPFSWVVRNDDRRRQLHEMALQFAEGSHAIDLSGAEVLTRAADIQRDADDRSAHCVVSIRFFSL